MAKAVKRLAAQLLKERHKQAKQTAKAAKSAGPDSAETIPPVKVARKQAARPTAPLRARCPPAAAKRATPEAGTPAPVEADYA